MGLKSWLLKRKALKQAREEENKHILSKKEQLIEQRKFLNETKILKKLVNKKK